MSSRSSGRSVRISMLIGRVTMLAVFAALLARGARRAWSVTSATSAPDPESDGDARAEADLAAALRSQLLAAGGEEPAATVLVPVNAQGDLVNIRRLMADLSGYHGRNRFDLVLVVNNFAPASPPPEIDRLRAVGATVVAIPDVRVSGEAVGFSARIPGARQARTGGLICFDADCRVPDPTALLDWYVAAFGRGIDVAYTHVGYHGLRSHPSIKVRMVTHHVARWVKRVILRIPTIRGSNYAIRGDLLIRLYDDGYLADDMNVGPVARHHRARIAYSGDRSLVVLTSGRMFRGGWRSLGGYLVYRVRYNARVLRVRRDAARHTGREADPPRRYVDDNPV